MPIDFIGPQIDAGFRLSHCVAPNNLVISAELSYLTLQYSNAQGELQFVFRMLKHLKGIWLDRAYPILWVTDKEDGSMNHEYDDITQYGIVKEINEWRGDRIDKDKVIDFLKKMFTELNYLKELEMVHNLILQHDPKESYTYTTVPSIDVHVVAVCINNKNEVLIAKRSNRKNTYPDKWEFGCGQIMINETFPQCLTRAYKRDFGVIISEASLVPIKIYKIEKNDMRTVTPGLIFSAECLANTQNVSFNKEKHSDVRWVAKDKIKELVNSDHVPDFYETIELAFQARENKA